MIFSKSGKIYLYIIFLLSGMLLGSLIGPMVIRRFYPVLFPKSERNGPSSEKAPKTTWPLVKQRPRHEVIERVDNSRTNAIIKATRDVSRCVVGIVVTELHVVSQTYQIYDFFDLFFAPELMPRYKEVENMGSGFIIDKSGLVLTNYHVVQYARKLYVNFQDGHEAEGEVIGVDPTTDLALIQIEEGDYPAATLGNSNDIIIGEWAIAIGNPFGFFMNDSRPSVTVGVISATNRNFAKSELAYYQSMIQTDAAINPGNSGGPLVNALGEVVGINTFIYTGSKSQRGSVGIGFAIPVNRAKRVAEELKKYGKRRRLYTGISVQNVNRTIALSLGLNRTDGVVITSVQKNSPGDAAGLKGEDVIVKMGDRSIHSTADIEGFFLDYFVGDKVNITVIRNGKKVTRELVLKEIPSRR
ncbi:MAG: trypsin-like serine protease [Chitinivibrionales bacterium]|nr:trypsin-like serine protease [Chitinivibrionales bacterium]